MEPEDVAREAQPETRTWRAVGVARPKERLGEPRQFVCRYAYPLVMENDPDILLRVLSLRS